MEDIDFELFNSVKKNSQQNVYFLFALYDLIQKLDKANNLPKQIIEIGTYKGGSTFTIKSINKIKNVPLYTFDINLTEYFNNKKNLLEKYNIHFFLADIFENEIYEKIKGLINQNGLTLVFCDGGNKIREFNAFGSLLKIGDIIFAHDFIETEKLAKKLNLKYEICNHDIEEISIQENLIPFFQKKFLVSKWAIRRKYKNNFGISEKLLNQISNYGSEEIFDNTMMNKTKVLKSIKSTEGQLYGLNQDLIPSLNLSKSKDCKYDFELNSIGVSKQILSPLSSKLPKDLKNNKEVNLSYNIISIFGFVFDVRINFFNEKNQLIEQKLINESKDNCELHINLNSYLNLDIDYQSWYVLVGLRSNNSQIKKVISKVLLKFSLNDKED